MQSKHNKEISSYDYNNIKHFIQRADIPFFVTLFCSLIFGGIYLAQLYFYFPENIVHLFSHIQILLSLFITIRGGNKSGYLVAIFLNVFLFLSPFFSHFIQSNTSPTVNILVPLSTIIIILIIHLFLINYNKKLAEIIAKNEDLADLNQKLLATQIEMEEQNKLLIAYNQIIKENEEQLSYLAYIDMLTELPNRKMLINRLDQLITSTEEPDVHFAVAFIDLDNFKQVNDTQGHRIGDLLLQAIAQKLQAAIHPKDMLGRLGGDEFALIIKRPLSNENIASYINELRQLLSKDLLIENQPLSVCASFGISLYPQDGSTSAELLNCADKAMYLAKDHKEIGFEFYNNHTLTDLPEKTDFDAHFNLALENEEFYLVFQPQYFASSKKLRGFEVLTRWYSPILGNVNPAQFIPIAEKKGLMILFGQWILTEACEKYKKIQNLYPHNIIMSVNISSIELMDPTFFPMVKNILNNTGVSGKNLEFEISESIFKTPMAQLTDILKKLKELDIQIALDDFGNSISYLNKLQKLPIDTIKINKVFIDDIDNSEVSNHPVASMVSLGHSMNMSVLAKGVETNTQFDYLKEQHCDCIQGYLFGKPLKEITFHRLLEELILYKNDHQLINRHPKDVLEAISLK